MSRLAIMLGQYSAKGRKETNQDFHGAIVPEPPVLTLKGICVAIADGISSSAYGAIAAETAVKSFLTDYYATSDAWTVKRAARTVITATNAWAYGQTLAIVEGGSRDRGMVATFSALVLKSRQAHIFHIGDTRVSRICGRSLEGLTEEHQVLVAGGRTLLGRALGADAHVEIDYRRVPLSLGDVFVLTSDGVHEHVTAREIVEAIASAGDDLDRAARRIADRALEAGSEDNLTVQILRIDALPEVEAIDLAEGARDLPVPGALNPRDELDGFIVECVLHVSNRSTVYLVRDPERDTRLVLKALSSELAEDESQRQRFVMEEWIAHRIDNPHVLKAYRQTRPRTRLYVIFDLVEGQTLTQWIADHPRPELSIVRDILRQVGQGLQAFHRKEMAHGDLRPENVLIDAAGTARIIDFGSVRAAGLVEAGDPGGDAMLGTLQYTAPECFLGEPAGQVSDVFSLGVIAYQMLTGQLPYGAAAGRAMTRAAQNKLVYASICAVQPEIPAFVDSAIRKAVHPVPQHRYREPAEFLHDLSHPNPAFETRRLAFAERDPLLFWKLVSLGLGLVVLYLLGTR